MSKIYLLARWWPLFRGDFPLDRFQDVADENVTAALDKLTQEFATQNAALIEAARQKQHKMDIARGGGGPKPRSVQDRPPTWREVSEVSGWVPRQRLLDEGDVKHGPHPTKWSAFYGTDDDSMATDVLEAVQLEVKPPHGFYAWRTERKENVRPARFVILERAVAGLRAAAAVSITRSVEDSRRRLHLSHMTARDRVADWLLQLHREATIAEAIILNENKRQVLKRRKPTTDWPSPPEAKKTKARAKIGRPPAGDAKQDARAWDMWKSRHYQTKAVLAKALGVTPPELTRMLDRHRKTINPTTRNRASRNNSGSTRNNSQ